MNAEDPRFGAYRRALALSRHHLADGGDPTATDPTATDPTAPVGSQTNSLLPPVLADGSQFGSPVYALNDIGSTDIGSTDIGSPVMGPLMASGAAPMAMSASSTSAPSAASQPLSTSSVPASSYGSNHLNLLSKSDNPANYNLPSYDKLPVIPGTPVTQPTTWRAPWQADNRWNNPYPLDLWNGNYHDTGLYGPGYPGAPTTNPTPTQSVPSGPPSGGGGSGSGSGSGNGGGSTAYVMGGYESTGNVSQDITNIYERLLGSDPTAEQSSYWAGQINSGAQTEADLAAAITNSSAYNQKQNADLVTAVYQRDYGRAPTAAETAAATKQLNNGLETPTAFIASIESSPEYRNYALNQGNSYLSYGQLQNQIYAEGQPGSQYSQDQISQSLINNAFSQDTGVMPTDAQSRQYVTEVANLIKAGETPAQAEAKVAGEISMLPEAEAYSQSNPDVTAYKVPSYGYQMPAEYTGTGAQPSAMDIARATALSNSGSATPGGSTGSGTTGPTTSSVTPQKGNLALTEEQSLVNAGIDPTVAATVTAQQNGGIDPTQGTAADQLNTAREYAVTLAENGFSKSAIDTIMSQQGYGVGASISDVYPLTPLPGQQNQVGQYDFAGNTIAAKGGLGDTTGASSYGLLDASIKAMPTAQIELSAQMAQQGFSPSAIAATLSQQGYNISPNAIASSMYGLQSVAKDNAAGSYDFAANALGNGLGTVTQMTPGYVDPNVSLQSATNNIGATDFAARALPNGLGNNTQMQAGYVDPNVSLQQAINSIGSQDFAGSITANNGLGTYSPRSAGYVDPNVSLQSGSNSIGGKDFASNMLANQGLGTAIGRPSDPATSGLIPTYGPQEAMVEQPGAPSFTPPVMQPQKSVELANTGVSFAPVPAPRPTQSEINSMTGGSSQETSSSTNAPDGETLVGGVIQNISNFGDRVSTKLGSAVSTAAGKASDIASQQFATLSGLLGGAQAASDFIQGMIGIESGGKYGAASNLSSAAGPGQFLSGTWNTVMRTLGLGNVPTSARTDPSAAGNALNMTAIMGYTIQNMQVLQANGIKPTPEAGYLMHNLGSGDGVRLLKADPNALVSSVLSGKVIGNNPGIYGSGNITVKQAINNVTNLLNSNRVQSAGGKVLNQIDQTTQTESNNAVGQQAGTPPSRPNDLTTPTEGNTPTSNNQNNNTTPPSNNTSSNTTPSNTNTGATTPANPNQGNTSTTQSNTSGSSGSSVQVAPGPTPAPTPQPTPTPTPAPTPAPHPQPTPAPTPTPAPSPSPAPSGGGGSNPSPMPVPDVGGNTGGGSSAPGPTSDAGGSGYIGGSSGGGGSEVAGGETAGGSSAPSGPVAWSGQLSGDGSQMVTVTSTIRVPVTTYQTETVPGHMETSGEGQFAVSYMTPATTRQVAVTSYENQTVTKTVTAQEASGLSASDYKAAVSSGYASASTYKAAQSDAQESNSPTPSAEEYSQAISDARESNISVADQIAQDNGWNSAAEARVAQSEGYSSNNAYETAAAEGFSSPSEYQAATSEGFTNPADYARASAEGFTNASDYATATSEGFFSAPSFETAMNEGFTNYNDYSTATSEGFTSPSEYETASSEGFTSAPTYEAASSAGYSDEQSYANDQFAQSQGYSNYQQYADAGNSFSYPDASDSIYWDAFFGDSWYAPLGARGGKFNEEHHEREALEYARNAARMR